MRWKSVLAVAVVALIAGCGAAPSTTAGSVTQASTARPAGSGPVAEQLQFTAKTVDGGDFSGESLAGKPAALWFWAPWCPNCQREAPGLAAVAKDNAEVTFLGVAALDKEPAMREFVDRFELDGFTHLADTDAEVWMKFGVTAQPAYAFIGRDGAVKVVTTQLSEQELRERVAAIAGS